MLAHPLETNLPGGTPIRVRVIGPADHGIIRASFERLSERSRYLRYLQPMKQLDEAYLASITRASDRDQFACGAFDRSGPLLAGQSGKNGPAPARTGDGELVAVARYVAMADTGDAAEFALTIVDSHQGRGLGTLLLGIIAAVAASHGIGRFIGVVHRDNERMINLMDDLRAVPRRDDPEVLEYTLALSRDADVYPATRAGVVFRRAAALLAAEQGRARSGRA